MPGFGSGIAHALTAGLTGYQQGEDDQRRQMIVLMAQRRAAEKDAREAAGDAEDRDLRRQTALINAAQAGLQIDGPSPVPVKDAASMRSVMNENPTSPEAGAANPQPAEPSQDGTVVGQVGNRTLKIPSGGLVGKAARDQAQKDAQKITERYEQLNRLNEEVKDPKMKRTPSQLRAIAANQTLYDQHVARATGLSNDPVQQHQAMRDYDVAHPTRDTGGDNTSWQLATDAKTGETYQVNPKTGATRPIAGLHGRVQTTGNSAQNQSTRVAAANLPELTTAAQNIEKFDDPTLLQALAKKAGVFGNYINTPEGQQLQQAVEQFVTLAELSKGNKRPTDAFIKRFEHMYAPAPGDLPPVREQKRAERRQLVESVTALAGSAGAAPNQTIVGATPSDHPATESIDAMIREGKSDAEIKAAIRRGAH